MLILGGCVTAPISPEFTERLDDVEPEEKDAQRDNRKQPDEQFKRQLREETELDRALQRLVDDLELAVMGLSDREPSDKLALAASTWLKRGSIWIL